MSEQPSPLNEDLDAALVDHYWSGELSGADRHQLDQWFDAHPGERERYALLRTSIAAGKATTSLSREDLSRRTESIFRAAGITQSAERATSRTVRVDGGRMVRRYVAIAVGITAVFIGGFLWNAAARSSGSDGDAESVYRTLAGQRATITLPGTQDTRLVLGPATSARILDRAGDGIAVVLDGEAVFDVTQAESVPFQVQTKNTVTRVLGTTFAVRQYATESTATVVVQSGRVSVGDGVVLDAGMLVTVDDSGAANVIRGGNVDEHFAWSQGRLVFRKAPVREIVAELRRAYDANIALADSSLADRELTWTVSVDQLSLSRALDALATVLGAHVQVSDSALTLMPGRKRPRHDRERHPVILPERYYGR